MRLLIALAALVLLAGPALAEKQDKVIFYQDPVYKPLNKDDEHPMKDLTQLAEGGDVRAQFILGDLYAKGKGGLVKNAGKAKHWFNESAMAGYGASFIRLAALAKHAGDNTQAYSWYDLGSSIARGKDARYASKARDALKLGSEDEDKADALSSEWRKARSLALSAKSDAEDAAKRLEAEAKKAAAEKEDAKPAEKAAVKAAAKAAKKKDPVEVTKTDTNNQRCFNQ